jgi:hypothetical protein
MGLSQLTRDAVLTAIREFDSIGREAFLRKYNFGPAREYFIRDGGKLYDSKAIAGAAHEYAVPSEGPLAASDFSGGEATVGDTLRQLGFTIQGPSRPARELPPLQAGRVYSWNELGALFAFKPQLFQVAGGMLPRPELDAILLITHPGGARSFDYEDRWEGDALIYTGRGKRGHQQLSGANRDVAENRKRLLVFEAAGSKQLLYRGEATCASVWNATGRDADSAERQVLKFRLVFDQRVEPAVASAPAVPRTSVPLVRRPRAFVPQEPTAYQRAATPKASPEETAALQEKANLRHSQVVARLATLLSAAGWKDVEEIPAAVDLWATPPDGSSRIMFEVKTISDSNELHQCRAAVAQLLEYRFFHGGDADRLCLVVDRPIPDRRRAFVESLGVAVVVVDSGGPPDTLGPLAVRWFGRTPLVPASRA